MTYKQAAGLQLNHEQPGEALIDVPDEKGRVTTRPFKECRVEQMRQALKLKRKPTSSKLLPPEAEARAEQYRQAVAVQFPKGKGTRVKVLARNDKGSAVLDFTGVPMEKVDQLLQALKAMQG
ncbi:hypothetical protein [Hyalangium gracile]|uniref:hypothetical protein n=1 Tax=Hyalangium gracile TaxID=394092 RepID=UPI001CCA2A14|nr:hypothetical protein [Hyalangium gracile]